MKEILFNYTHIETGEEMSLYEKGFDNNEVVLEPNQSIVLVIDYPLDVPYEETFNTGSKGMTRGKLSKKICEAYREIYREDESSGAYEIWGHEIDELMLGGARLEDGVLSVEVDS